MIWAFSKALLQLLLFNRPDGNGNPADKRSAGEELKCTAGLLGNSTAAPTLLTKNPASCLTGFVYG